MEQQPSDGSGSEGAVTENKHAVVANLKKTGNEPKRKKPRVSAASSESPSSSSESDEIVPFDELHLQRCTDPAQLKSWWEGEVEADCKLQFWDGKILKAVKGKQLKQRYRPAVLEVKSKQEKCIYKVTNPCSIVRYVVDPA